METNTYIVVPTDTGALTYLINGLPCVIKAAKRGNTLQVFAPEQFTRKWHTVSAALWMQVDAPPGIISRNEHASLMTTVRR